MNVNKDLMSLGALLLILFVIGIITGVTFIGFQYMKETACETAYDGYEYYNETCFSTLDLVNSSNNVEATVTPLTKINIVENVLDVVLGLLALVAVVAIFAIIIRAAKGMASSKGGF